MPSSQKTPLGLNQWQNNDVPDFADHNADNFIVDGEIQRISSVIVDSGSNGNGIWIRYASGIQVCYKQIQVVNAEITQAAGSYYYGGNWNSGPYAQNFVSNGDVMVLATAASASATYCDAAVRGININTGQCSGFLTRPTSATIEMAYVNLTAVGMWK